MKKFFNIITKAAAKARRKMLANEIFERHKGEVQRGEFKGLLLDGSSNVSRGPLGLKILGLYENLVVEEIVVSAPFKDLINFGAADGYMSLGPLFAGFCQRSICFEMTQEGRHAVARNADLNKLTDKVEIRGIVDDSILIHLDELDISPKHALILCDIEGAEFDVLNSKVLNDLRGAKIIVELHDRIMEGGVALRNALIERLPDGARYRILRSGETLSYNSIEDLESLSDNDRALVLSDGRKVFGEWMVIDYP
jgi:hypothetical protein